VNLDDWAPNEDLPCLVLVIVVGTTLIAYARLWQKPVLPIRPCVLTVSLFGLIRYHGQVLKQGTRSKEELAMRDLRLEDSMSALPTKPASKPSAIEVNAPATGELRRFLPRQGREYADQIKETSAQWSDSDRSS
jgi:hypothetical protein